MKEIGRKEAGESRDFPILDIRIVDDNFQMEGKKCKTKKDVNGVKKKVHARAREMLQHSVSNSLRVGSGGGS